MTISQIDSHLIEQKLPSSQDVERRKNLTAKQMWSMRRSGVLRRRAAAKPVRIQVFVRQPFTESGNLEKEVIQGVLDVLGSLPLDVVTGLEAQSQETFRKAFEASSGLPFTPGNFRAARLALLQAADAMVFIRTSLSESGAFEAAYNVYAGPQVPMFFAVWKHAPIKTTLLRDLDEFCTATYVTFEQPEELRLSLEKFLAQVAQEIQTRTRSGRGESGDPQFTVTKRIAMRSSSRRSRPDQAAEKDLVSEAS